MFKKFKLVLILSLIIHQTIIANNSGPIVFQPIAGAHNYPIVRFVIFDKDDPICSFGSKGYFGTYFWNHVLVTSREFIDDYNSVSNDPNCNSAKLFIHYDNFRFISPLSTAIEKTAIAGKLGLFAFEYLTRIELTHVHKLRPAYPVKEAPLPATEHDTPLQITGKVKNINEYELVGGLTKLLGESYFDDNEVGTTYQFEDAEWSTGFAGAPFIHAYCHSCTERDNGMQATYVSGFRVGPFKAQTFYDDYPGNDSLTSALNSFWGGTPEKPDILVSNVFDIFAGAYGEKLSSKQGLIRRGSFLNHENSLMASLQNITDGSNEPFGKIVLTGKNETVIAVEKDGYAIKMPTKAIKIKSLDKTNIQVLTIEEDPNTPTYSKSIPISPLPIPPESYMCRQQCFHGWLFDDESSALKMFMVTGVAASVAAYIPSVIKHLLARTTYRDNNGVITMTSNQLSENEFRWYIAALMAFFSYELYEIFHYLPYVNRDLSPGMQEVMRCSESCNTTKKNRGCNHPLCNKFPAYQAECNQGLFTNDLRSQTGILQCPAVNLPLLF